MHRLKPNISRFFLHQAVFFDQYINSIIKVVAAGIDKPRLVGFGTFGSIFASCCSVSGSVHHVFLAYVVAAAFDCGPRKQDELASVSAIVHGIATEDARRRRSHTATARKLIVLYLCVGSPPFGVVHDTDATVVLWLEIGTLVNLLELTCNLPVRIHICHVKLLASLPIDLTFKSRLLHRD